MFSVSTAFIREVSWDRKRFCFYLFIIYTGNRVSLCSSCSPQSNNPLCWGYRCGLDLVSFSCVPRTYKEQPTENSWERRSYQCEETEDCFSHVKRSRKRSTEKLSTEDPLRIRQLGFNRSETEQAGGVATGFCFRNGFPVMCRMDQREASVAVEDKAYDAKR